ncbi:hypothetical protein [Pedococcus bigeumensis]|jgi:hypothetical protein|uniref:hypothetical protein n=1 Tax=Pedococcus bigeumensis TaxID=433644 RepID=UPI0031CDB9FD
MAEKRPSHLRLVRAPAAPAPAAEVLRAEVSRANTEPTETYPTETYFAQLQALRDERRRLRAG